MPIEDFFDAVTNTKIGTVHVTSNDEDDCDRQMVMRHIRQPERLSLRMKTTQEGQDRRTRTSSRAENMASSIRILSIHPPIASEERC